MEGLAGAALGIEQDARRGLGPCQTMSSRSRAARLGPTRARLSAHMRTATRWDAFTTVEPPAEVFGERGRRQIASGHRLSTTWDIHVRQPKRHLKHLPYGEGTLRAEPLAEALARFERPATVISEP